MKVLKRIFRFILPYWKHMVIAIFASFIFAFLNGFTMWMSATFIETIFSPAEQSEQISEPFSENESNHVIENIQENFSLNNWLKDKTRSLIERNTRMDTLKMVCLIVFLAFLLKNIFGYTRRILITRVNYLTVNNIRNSLYGHLQKLSLSYYEQRKGGQITSILVNDVSVLSTTLSNNFGKLIVTPMQILLLIAILFIINWKLTLLVFIIVPVMGIVITKIGQSIRRKSRRTYRQTAVFISILQETISALRIVKAFAMEREEIKKFKEATYKFYHLIVRQKSLQLLANPVNEMLAVMAIIVLLWYGGSQVLHGGSLTPEDFVRFMIVLFSAFQPLRELTGVNTQLQAGLAAAERIFSIMDTIPEIKDHPETVNISEFKNEIEFKDVWFRYQEDSPYVLKNINLNIKRGEVVAFVGQSGAGKSTLVDMVPRFYEVTKGKILIDGQDIRRIENESLKQIFGIVTQETILFNDTLEYNIAYGSSTHDELAIHQAANVANAHDFILELEEGYHAVVGDRGVKLSGGQRQRIAIARAILRNPPILILDEATSSLDTESEKAVQEAINNLMKNRTVLVIAHRLSTVIHADKIVIIDKGEIADIGPHRKLLKISSLYRRLYKMQFKDQEDKEE